MRITDGNENPVTPRHRGIPSLACSLTMLAFLAPQFATAQDANDSHPLEPAIKLAQESYKAIDDVDGFEATFTKRETVRGRLQGQQTMFMRLRHEPLSVYLYFQNPHKGRQVLFVENQNGGNILARETGIASLVGTVRLQPNSEQAMAESPYPITLIGIKSMIKSVIQQWQKGLKSDAVKVVYYNHAKAFGMECRAIQVTYNKPVEGHRFHMTQLFIDKKTNFPVRVVQYGFPRQAGAQAPLIEEYTYTNIRANNALTDTDFHPRKYGL